MTTCKLYSQTRPSCPNAPTDVFSFIKRSLKSRAWLFLGHCKMDKFGQSLRGLLLIWLLHTEKKNRFQLFVPYSLFLYKLGDGIRSFFYTSFFVRNQKRKKNIGQSGIWEKKKLDPFFPEPHDCTEQNKTEQNLTFINSSHEIHGLEDSRVFYFHSQSGFQLLTFSQKSIALMK